MVEQKIHNLYCESSSPSTLKITKHDATIWYI